MNSIAHLDGSLGASGRVVMYSTTARKADARASFPGFLRQFADRRDSGWRACDWSKTRQVSSGHLHL